MAIKLEKSKLALNKVIANKIETITINGDSIVPDIKPDILEIIGTSGTVNIYKKEVMDGKVRVDGSVQVYVMYLGDDGKTKGVRSINHTLDFSQTFNIEDITSEMNANIEVKLLGIESRIINERKINLKANLEFRIQVLANTEVEYVNNIALKDIQKLESTISVNSVLGMGQTKTIIKETVNIDANDNLAEILKINETIGNKSIKISYNKILAKADLRLKMLYLTEDGRVNSVNAKFPVMGFIDIQNISEDNSIEYDFEIKNMVIKPNRDSEHSIYVEIEIGINVIAYNKNAINVIEDLYSPTINLGYKQENIQMIQDKLVFNNVYNINQKELLSITDEKIYDVDTNVVLQDIKVNNNEVLVNGNIGLNFVCSTTDNSLQIRQLNIPLENRIECKGLTKNANVKVKTDIILDDFDILPGGEVNIKIDINFELISEKNINIQLIKDVEELENDKYDDYNMVIYQVKPNDSLWKIAKEFNSTVESIIDTNELTSNEIMPGEQLFIEKYMR